jgi:Rho GTPase-activating protein RGD1
MSLGAAPNANGDEVSPIKDDSTAAPPPAQSDPNIKAVHDVINSEIGVATLLNRLKQSIASAKVRSPRASVTSPN